MCEGPYSGRLGHVRVEIDFHACDKKRGAELGNLEEEMLFFRKSRFRGRIFGGEWLVGCGIF